MARDQVNNKERELINIVESKAGMLQKLVDDSVSDIINEKQVMVARNDK
jgi:hypothetical protein